MTNFEKQKKIFDEFIENIQDRFNLIIKDGVNIIFDKDYIMFDELILVRYSIRNLIPELMFRDSIKTPGQFAMLRNIINNFEEITSILKEYMTLYLHMNDFKDKGLSDDEEYTDYNQDYEDTYDKPDGEYIDENYSPDLDDWTGGD